MSRREQIEKLGLTNPIVHNCLNFNRYRPGITYQEALEEMVVALAGVLEASQAEHLRLLQEGPMPVIFINKDSAQ